MNILVHTVSDDYYKEDLNCLCCEENKRCKLATKFKENVGGAVVVLCPHTKEFTCSADVQSFWDDNCSSND